MLYIITDNLNSILRIAAVIFLLVAFPSCKQEEAQAKTASIQSLTINGQTIANGGTTNNLPIDKPVAIDIEFSNAINTAQWNAGKIYIPSIDSTNFKIAQGSSNKHLILTIDNKAFKSYSSYPLTVFSGENLGINLVDNFTCTLMTGLDSVPKFPLISDDSLLTLVQQQTFKYFWDFGHPICGMARERTTSGDIVTTGGTGFGIMAMIVAVERGFITRTQAVERLQTIVSFLETKCTSYHGAFSHWINGSTGKTVPFSAYDDGGDSFMGNLVLDLESNSDKDSLDIKGYLYNAASPDWKGQDIRLHKPAFLTDKWVHIACSYDNLKSTMALWANGVFVGDGIKYSTGADPVTGNQPLLGDLAFGSDMNKIHIGAWAQQIANTADSWMRYFPGLIDELRIYNKALSDQEVSDLYAAEITQIN